MRRAIAILGFAGFLWAAAPSVDAQTLSVPATDGEKAPAPINGIERINWIGDTSTNGLKQSYAMMVNYRYKLGDVDANHEAYASGKIVASREVRALAKG